MAERGVERTSDALRDMLEELTKTSARRAAGASWGRPRLFCRPLGTDHPAPADVPLTRAAALRQAVLEARRALGRPVSPLEVKLWGAAHPDHPAVVALGAALGPLGLFSGRLRALVSNKRPTLVSLAHPLTTDGGIPLRVAEPNCPEIDAIAGRFADACEWLRPTDDRRGTDRLREEGARPGLHALNALAAVRDDVVEYELRRALGDAAPADLLQRLVHAGECLTAWWRPTTKRGTPRSPRWLADARDVRAEAERLAATPLLDTGTPRDVARAGRAGVRSIEEVAVWLRELLRPEGRDFETVQQHIRTVRRFPNPGRGRGRLYEGSAVAFSVLDVGDVLARLSELTSDGSLAVLLQRAGDLLGTSVRAAGVLRACCGRAAGAARGAPAPRDVLPARRRRRARSARGTCRPGRRAGGPQ